MNHCGNCQDRWRLFLAQESNTNNMKDKEKQSEKLDITDDGKLQSGPAPEVNLHVNLQATVPPLQKPDVNKIIEERRKALQDGKIIKK